MALDADEPARVADAVAKLNLTHVVITSVDRDDLDDGGAAHFAHTIDAIRAAKIAKDRGIGGPILSASSYFMKSPPVQYHDDEAHRMVEDFASGT